MKNLFFAAVVLFTTFEVVFSQCDSRGIQGLKQCYGLSMNTGNTTTSLYDLINAPDFPEDFPSYCKLHSKKVKCLGNYEKICLNIPAFSQAFGTNETESMWILHFDYLYEYQCNAENIPEQTCDYDGDTIDAKCEASLNFVNPCQYLSAHDSCFLNALKEHCNDKEYIDFETNATNYSLQKMGCNV